MEVKMAWWYCNCISSYAMAKSAIGPAPQVITKQVRWKTSWSHAWVLHGPEGCAVVSHNKTSKVEWNTGCLPHAIRSDGRWYALGVKRDHCTALWAVQHPSMTPTGFVSVVC